MRPADWVADVASRGQYTFTTEELSTASSVSRTAARAALRRLKQKGIVATPHRGFHVIVPPEYRRLGCLPAEQFLPQLMEYLGQAYYAALLSAARYHGAAHQQPQVYQVMLARNRARISCGLVRIHFIARRNVAVVPAVRFNTPRGYVTVSSPEATAFDLVGYHQHAGGLDHVVTLLSELGESLTAKGLAAMAELSPTPWAQRLGYLLERVGAGRKAALLARHVARAVREDTPLLPGRRSTRAHRDPRWKLVVNTQVEPEA